MPRPIWKGAVSFGLVTVPVNLYPATRRQAELAFRSLHKKDHAPIDSLASDREPRRYKDTYRQTRRAAIEGKLAGKEVAVPRARKPARVANLMKALEKSLATGRPPLPKIEGGRAKRRLSGARPAQRRRKAA